MKPSITLAGMALSLSATAFAAGDPPRSDVSIYRAAPGHQVALLKFLQAQQAAAKAAGMAEGQLYVHQTGASWDYIMISPHATEAQDKASDAAAMKMGIVSGSKMGLEFRQHVAEHSDTIAEGPMTISEFLAQSGQ